MSVRSLSIFHYHRKGVLPQMLKEILDTRVMVKRSMKLYKDDATLQRVLHSRSVFIVVT